MQKLICSDVDFLYNTITLDFIL